MAAAVDLTHLDPVPFTSLLGPDDPFPGTKIGQPVVLGGTWVPDGTVFVSGREQGGTSGYWVVTPLARYLVERPTVSGARLRLDVDEAGEVTIAPA